MNTDAICWSISDGRAGNSRQALALARALRLRPRVLDIRVRRPWKWMAPRLTAGALRGIRCESAGALSPPWPDIAIGCGRQAALLTRVLREHGDGRCFSVQILDPRIDPAHYDIVVAPRHDGVTGTNVTTTIGALNPVDTEWLAEGRARFAAPGSWPTPRTTVLIGASNRAQRLDAAYFDGLLERMEAWHALGGGSFLVTASRRTPTRVIARLRAGFARFPGVFWADRADGENPYAGFLAWADRLVVTPDSVNLISEACATGKPVYTFAPRPIAGKLAGFHAQLLASGHLRRLDDTRRRAQPPPLAETAAVAELIRERWQRARTR